MMPLMTSRVTLRQLQYIVAVADREGFGRAADACHVAQPSLSAQVALAEQALGVRIFERGRRRIHLSTAGARLVDAARRVLLAAADLEETARALTDPFTGTVRIGVIPTIGPYLLPDITPRIAGAYPALKVLWFEARTPELVRRLKAGELDGVLVAADPSVRDLEHAAIGVDTFVLAGRRDHPLLRSKTLGAADVLRRANVLLLDDGHCLRDQALQVCKRTGAREDSFRATSLGTLVQMVSAGDSVTLLPSLALGVENRRGQLGTRRFTTPEPSRTLLLAWRRGAAAGRTFGALAATIRAATNRRGRSLATSLLH